MIGHDHPGQGIDEALVLSLLELVDNQSAKSVTPENGFPI
ncbi:hypothetical protein EMIT0194P_60280 [Pseudomonas serbica]|jgi:hypothetical protein